MIAAARLTQGLCLMAAFVLHLAGFSAWFDDDAAEIAAAGAPAQAQLGSSFADLAAGVMQAISTTAVTAAPTVEPLQPIKSTNAAARSDTAQATEVAPLRAVIPPSSAATARVQVAATLDALRDTALTQSIRPVARPPDVKPAAPMARPGNAGQDATAGASNDSNQGQASPSGSITTAPTASAQSGAAATNYPGEVLRRIASIRRPRTNARGVAVVSFRITQNGDVVGVGILRSSGDRDLDQIALRVIRTAAPFPPPPSGAKTSWQIEIAGR